MNATQQEIRPGIKVFCINEFSLTPDFTARPNKAGKVTSIDEVKKTAAVEYEVPDLPMECKKCGCTSGLMFNKRIGQVECFMTGCGHEQGFKTVSVNIHVSRLRKK